NCTGSNAASMTDANSIVLRLSSTGVSRPISAITCVAAALLLGLNLAQAVEITRVGQWVNQGLGDVYTFSTYSNYAYAITPSGLQVFDISSRTNPVRLTGTSFFPSSIVLSSNYAYLTSTGGLQVLSLSNPISPARVGVVTNIGLSGSMAVSGNYLYLAES